jgi:hypothetical protein
MDVGTRRLVLLVDDVDYTSSVSRAQVQSAETDSDFVSFADAAAGGARDYVLALTLKQNTAANSLWSIIWMQAGDDLGFELWPNGKPVDAIPTEAQPLIEGIATVTEPDGVLVGGEANVSNTARMTTEVEWPTIGKPTRTPVPA